jgi:hypothetical protein
MVAAGCGSRTVHGMKAQRFVVSTLVVLTLSACSSAAPEPSSIMTPSTTAAPSVTVPSKALILGRLRAPVLEAFSATYRWGVSPVHAEQVVVQDDDLNLSYSSSYLSESGGMVVLHEVILHDGVVYVRLNAEDDDLAADMQRGIGVPRGEWFPLEEWRMVAAAATFDWDFPSEYSASGWAQNIEEFHLLPYKARVLASLAHGEQVPTPDEACFRVNREFLYSQDLDGARLQVRRTPENRWVLDGPCYLSVAFDDLGRMTSLAGQSDGKASENGSYGALAVTYGPQPAVVAPDTSWFKANKNAVKKALRAAGMQADRDYKAEKARLGESNE